MIQSFSIYTYILIHTDTYIHTHTHKTHHTHTHTHLHRLMLERLEHVRSDVTEKGRKRDSTAHCNTCSTMTENVPGQRDLGHAAEGAATTSRKSNAFNCSFLSITSLRSCVHLGCILKVGRS